MALGRALPTRWVQCKGVPWQDILCLSILTETGGPVVEYPQANGTEHLRKLGKLIDYYLDEFNQNGVFIRRKQ
jgi:hypothetical protein